MKTKRLLYMIIQEIKNKGIRNRRDVNFIGINFMNNAGTTCIFTTNFYLKDGIKITFHKLKYFFPDNKFHII